MFGGYFETDPSSKTYFKDLWEWSGSDWALVTTGIIPERGRHAAAFDIARDVLVVYGGRDFWNFYGDTWEWNRTTWTQRKMLPEERSRIAAAFDNARGVSVFFGGSLGVWEDLGDTLEWDGSNFELRAETGPTPRQGHAMAYDSARQVTVLFGGYDGTHPEDTWEWDGVNWLERATNEPVPSSSGKLAYDAARGTVIMYGGYDGRPLGQTWEWNGNSWQFLSDEGPRPRAGNALTFDSKRSVIVLFGGGGTGGSTSYFNDTWEWNGTMWALRASEGPSPRSGAAISFDERRQVTVLFGGRDQYGNLPNETWEWDGETWKQRFILGPPSTREHVLVYDSARGVSVHYGGALNAVWELVSRRIDSDDDGDLDLVDIGAFQACYGNGASSGVCSKLDADGNEIINAYDLSSFNDALSGPGQ